VSPTVRDDSTVYEHHAATVVSAPRRARGYAFGLLALALFLVVTIAARGAEVPSPGLLLVLAIPLALCMNRYLFFPNEVGVTADSAVLFAAMVAFRGDAQWIGPVVLALLTGPLDARHWGERAFSRMAYNSGSTTLVVAAGLVAFVPLSHLMGTGWEATLAAAAMAAVPYLVTESILGITLLVLLGERLADAARHQLPLHAMAFPLTVVGAAAGLAAVGVGWWLGLLVLLPVPFAPELVMVTVPRRTTPPVRWLAMAACALTASAVLPGPAGRAVTGLVAVACLVFSDRAPATRFTRWCPPLVALVATIPLAAFPFGVRVPTFAIVLAALVGSLALVMILRVSGSGRDVAGWSMPVVLLTAGAARLWGLEGRFGAPVFVALVVVALVFAAHFGPPPWPSRVLSRVSTRPSRLGVDLLLAGTIACAVAATCIGGSVGSGLAVAAATALEASVVAAAFAVRMWRFRPRRRAVDVALLATIGVLGVLVVPELAPLAAVIGALAAAWLTRVSPANADDSTQLRMVRGGQRR
jgi:hypothetical protein